MRKEFVGMLMTIIDILTVVIVVVSLLIIVRLFYLHSNSKNKKTQFQSIPIPKTLTWSTGNIYPLTWRSKNKIYEEKKKENLLDEDLYKVINKQYRG